MQGSKFLLHPQVKGVIGVILRTLMGSPRKGQPRKAWTPGHSTSISNSVIQITMQFPQFILLRVFSILAKAPSITKDITPSFSPFSTILPSQMGLLNPFFKSRNAFGIHCHCVNFDFHCLLNYWNSSLMNEFLTTSNQHFLWQAKLLLQTIKLRMV